jgi:hypothetical protein
MLTPIRLASTLLAAIALLAACQGDFEPPALDSPRDPANGQLPATPDMTGLTASCVDGEPEIRIQWSAADDPLLTGFQIYRGRSLSEDPGTLIATVPATARSFVDGAVGGIPGLAPNALYYYRMRALGRDGTPGLRSGAEATLTPPCP